MNQEPFRQYNLEEEGKRVDSFTVRLNIQERADLEEDKKTIKQKKDSTAIKQLWRLGRNVLHDNKTKDIIDTLFKNKANNKRMNISDFD